MNYIQFYFRGCKYNENMYSNGLADCGIAFRTFCNLIFRVIKSDELFKKLLQVKMYSIYVFKVLKRINMAGGRF